MFKNKEITLYHKKVYVNLEVGEMSVTKEALNIAIQHQQAEINKLKELADQEMFRSESKANEEKLKLENDYKKTKRVIEDRLIEETHKYKAEIEKQIIEFENKINQMKSALQKLEGEPNGK